MLNIYRILKDEGQINLLANSIIFIKEVEIKGVPIGTRCEKSHNQKQYYFFLSDICSLLLGPQNKLFQTCFMWVDIAQRNQGKLLSTKCTLYFSKLQELKITAETHWSETP